MLACVWQCMLHGCLRRMCMHVCDLASLPLAAVTWECTLMAMWQCKWVDYDASGHASNACALFSRCPHFLCQCPFRHKQLWLAAGQ